MANRERQASPITSDHHLDLPGRFRPLHSISLPNAAKLRLDDTDQIMNYLSSFDSFADAPQEGHNYINYALKRFIITVDMVPPADSTRKTLLEIGGSPYYTTILLHQLRGYEIYLTNFFGDDYSDTGQQVVSSQTYNESYECNFVNVNIEKDSLPYPDHSFDMVLFCEVIEHLTQDPTFALVELHRVLKPDGHLLVTTPNVFRLQHVLQIVKGRQNIFHPYSGHGIYGRHQREYSLGELANLVGGCGYTILRSEIEDFEPQHNRLEHLAKRFWRHRRDNLFVLARKQEKCRFYYPSSLYIATQGIQRVVDSDVRMGSNDVGHLGSGWWGVDPVGEEKIRWTTDEARINLTYPQAGGHEIVIEANGMGKTLGPVSVTLSLGQQKRQFQLDDDSWQELSLPLLCDEGTEKIECCIQAKPTRCPRDLNVNADSRKLGLMVRRVYIQ
jgi:SAM-dependent methyltransferase